MKTRHISRRFRRFAKANEAVSALEYALLVGIITIGVGAALVTFSTDVKNAIEAVALIGELIFCRRDFGHRQGRPVMPGRRFGLPA